MMFFLFLIAYSVRLLIIGVAWGVLFIRTGVFGTRTITNLQIMLIGIALSPYEISFTVWLLNFVHLQGLDYVLFLAPLLLSASLLLMCRKNHDVNQVVKDIFRYLQQVLCQLRKPVILSGMIFFLYCENKLFSILHGHLEWIHRLDGDVGSLEILQHLAVEHPGSFLFIASFIVFLFPILRKLSKKFKPLRYGYVVSVPYLIYLIFALSKFPNCLLDRDIPVYIDNAISFLGKSDGYQASGVSVPYAHTGLRHGPLFDCYLADGLVSHNVLFKRIDNTTTSCVSKVLLLLTQLCFLLSAILTGTSLFQSVRLGLLSAEIAFLLPCGQILTRTSFQITSILILILFLSVQTGDFTKGCRFFALLLLSFFALNGSGNSIIFLGGPFVYFFFFSGTSCKFSRWQVSVACLILFTMLFSQRGKHTLLALKYPSTNNLTLVPHRSFYIVKLSILLNLFFFALSLKKRRDTVALGYLSSVFVVAFIGALFSKSVLVKFLYPRYHFPCVIILPFLFVYMFHGWKYFTFIRWGMFCLLFGWFIINGMILSYRQPLFFRLYEKIAKITNPYSYIHIYEDRTLVSFLRRIRSKHENGNGKTITIYCFYHVNGALCDGYHPLKSIELFSGFSLLREKHIPCVYVLDDNQKTNFLQPLLYKGKKGN